MRAWWWTAATPHARSRRIATRSCVSKNGDRVVFVLKSSLSPFLTVLLVFLAPHLAASSDGPASVHFKVGERLTYSLRWGIIAAGAAVMEVAERQTLAGRPVVKLVHTARSNEFISAFYPVNNRVESLLDEEAGYPHHLLFKRRDRKSTRLNSSQRSTS